MEYVINAHMMVNPNMIEWKIYGDVLMIDFLNIFIKHWHIL